MKQYKNTHGDLLVLKRGEELVKVLNNYAIENDLASAWVSGLGAAGEAVLGFYDLEAKDYEWREFKEPLEILNLTGNLSWVDGQPFWHLHGSFGTREYQMIGGHVRSLNISLTGELLVTQLEQKLTRTYNPATGLKFLDK